MKTSKSFFILFLLTPLTFLLGDIINVPADTSTIQGGIFLANEGDTVLVSEGTYYENINFRGKAITVASMFIMDEDTSHISKTIIDGSKPTHADTGSVVNFTTGEDTSSVICGFTITGGTGSYVYIPSINAWMRKGGGINLIESGAKILNNNIQNNHIVVSEGCNGGGISAFSNESEINFVMIKGNRISNNSLTGNRVAGAGIVVFLSSINYVIEENIIENNQSTVSGWKSHGGGICCNQWLPSSGTMIVRNNVIRNNKLFGEYSFGGGMYIVDRDFYTSTVDIEPNPLVYNNIIVNNYSEGMGGGIAVWRFDSNYPNTGPLGDGFVPQPAIINNTIVNNVSKNGYGFVIVDAVPLVMNNIIWNSGDMNSGKEIYINTINAPFGTWTNQHGDIELYYSDIQGGWEGEGNIDAYPSFVDTTINDFSLLELSPCIGKGIDSIQIGGYWYKTPGTDFYGNIRPHPVDDSIDIGAIESDFPVGIFDYFLHNPSTHRLSQNYPNPFNPSTTIEFTLPKSEYVELKVFNILGKEVATLVSNKLNSGNHIYQFDGKNLASGIYYYQLIAGDYREVKKMILIK